MMMTVRACALWFTLLATLASAAEKAPDKLPNGERPWPELPAEEIANILAALPDKPEMEPEKARKLLVFYRTDGFPHTSIPSFNKMLEMLGEKTGAYTATLSQSYDDLMPDRIMEYDAVFFNNTCRMKTPEPVKAALMAFVRSGRGFAANHGAGDNWHDWPEGMEMLGAKFVCHPFGRIQVKLDDAQSPLTRVFEGEAFSYHDEIYAFKDFSRSELRILLSIDYESSPEVPKAEARLLERAAAVEARPVDKDFAQAVREDRDYPIAWIRPWGEGRVFFCSLGHRHEVTWDPKIVRFFLAGIQYALGDLKADDTPVAPPSGP